MRLSGLSILAANRFLVKIGLIISLVFMATVYLVLPLWIFTNASIFENLFMLGVFALYLGPFILAWRHLTNRVGVFFALISIVFCGYLMYEFFVSYELYQVFPLIGMTGFAFVLFFIFLLFPMLLNLGIQFIMKRRKKLSWGENFAATRRQVHLSGGSILCAGVLLIAGGSCVVILSGETALGTVLIQPQNYQAKLAFWGSHYMSRYNSTQLDALNRHNAIICPYTIGDLSTPATQTAFINEMTAWNTSYPFVSFLPAVVGIPGGYVWDGSARGTTELAKQIVQLVHDNNLTNVKGLSFDWEQPDEKTLGGMSSAPNRTRHEESIAIWNAFFDWMEINAPEMITQNINYVPQSVDNYDGDFDIHYVDKFNTFEVPRWSEYAPMIYRCGTSGTRPFGDVPHWTPGTRVDVTYNFYAQVKSHVEGVIRAHGNANRAGVYIGITNCTCYGRDVEITEFGEDLGHGYDVLVRDALICKSFGMPRITVFILTTEMSAAENGYSMGGVFESYGDTFLDDFNASVNGPDSTKAFSIPIGQLGVSGRLVPDTLDPYVKDLLYSFDNPLLFLLFIGIVVVLVYATLRKSMPNPRKSPSKRQ